MKRVLHSWIIAVVLVGSQHLRAAHFEVYPPGSVVHGKTIGEWTAEWWKWATSIPRTRSPIIDATGQYCAESWDPTSEVFFLAGATGPGFQRVCSIPCGRDILIAIVNVLAWAPGDCDPNQLPDCRAVGRGFIDAAGQLILEIDGESVPDLQTHREESPFFKWVAPEDNIFGLAPGTYDGYSDGYWVLVKSLSPGLHTIRVLGEIINPPFTAEVTTKLTVEPCSGFRRGDADSNSAIELTDAVKLLNFLFLGGPEPECLDAADFHDSGVLDISDAIASLNYQFLGGAAPSAPGPASCGPDPTNDGLSCTQGC